MKIIYYVFNMQSGIQILEAQRDQEALVQIPLIEAKIADQLKNSINKSIISKRTLNRIIKTGEADLRIKLKGGNLDGSLLTNDLVLQSPEYPKFENLLFQQGVIIDNLSPRVDQGRLHPPWTGSLSGAVGGVYTGLMAGVLGGASGSTVLMNMVGGAILGTVVGQVVSKYYMPKASIMFNLKARPEMLKSRILNLRENPKLPATAANQSSFGHS